MDQQSVPPDGLPGGVRKEEMTVLQKCYVLLVEDNPLNQMLGKAMLEHCGCRVEVAGNGREAVDALNRQRYDMIFMDCQMPVMDGYEATAAIRAMEGRSPDDNEAHRIPIVALTAYDSEGDREQCRLSGMDDYISKPFNLATIQATVERWYTSRRAGGRCTDQRKIIPPDPVCH
jgi:CheY-like chemotaxis protein